MVTVSPKFQKPGKSHSTSCCCGDCCLMMQSACHNSGNRKGHPYCKRSVLLILATSVQASGGWRVKAATCEIGGGWCCVWGGAKLEDFIMSERVRRKGREGAEERQIPIIQHKDSAPCLRISTYRHSCSQVCWTMWVCRLLRGLVGDCQQP